LKASSDIVATTWQDIITNPEIQNMVAKWGQPHVFLKMYVIVT